MGQTPRKGRHGCTAFRIVLVTCAFAILCSVAKPAPPVPTAAQEHPAETARQRAEPGLYAVDVESGTSRLVFPWGPGLARCGISRDLSMVAVVGIDSAEMETLRKQAAARKKVFVEPDATKLIRMGPPDSMLNTVWKPGHPGDPNKKRYVRGANTSWPPVWSWDNRRVMLDAWDYVVVFNREGKYRWYSSGEERGKVLDRLSRGGKLSVPNIATLPVVNFRCVRWAGSSSGLVVSTSDDGLLRLMDVATGETRVLCETPDKKGTAHVSQLAVSADAYTVAFFNDMSDRGGLYVWRKGERQPRRIATGQTREGALSPDGRYVACQITRFLDEGGAVSRLEMYRADTGKLVWYEEVLGAHRFAFDSKSNRLAYSGSDGGPHIMVTPVEQFEPKRLVSGISGCQLNVRSWSADDREVIYKRSGG